MFVWWVGCWLSDAEIADKATDPRGPADTDVTETDRPDTDDPDPDEPLRVADLWPGELLITEAMRNPAACDDAEGEWLELHNPLDRAIDLDGLWLVDDGSDAWQVRGQLVLEPGAYVVFGASDHLESNGGAPVDVEWHGIALANGTDEVALKGPDDVTLDRIRWSPSMPGQAGASMSLAANYYDADANDLAEAWCEPTETYGLGDHGTPGRPNGRCP